MLRQNGQVRQFNGRGLGATTEWTSSPDEIGRRVAALIGEDSPLRPNGLGSMARPSAELAGAFARLSEAFQQLREALQGVDAQVVELRATAVGVGEKVDHLKERIDLEDARVAAFHQRLTMLETKQGATLEGIHGQVADLTRQVSLALGIAVLLGTLSIAALFLVR